MGRSMLRDSCQPHRCPPHANRRISERRCHLRTITALFFERVANDDYLRRTTITRLSVSNEQASLLEDTIDEWWQVRTSPRRLAENTTRSQSGNSSRSPTTMFVTRRVSGVNTPSLRASKLHNHWKASMKANNRIALLATQIHRTTGEVQYTGQTVMGP